MTNAHPDTNPSTPVGEGVARRQHHGSGGEARAAAADAYVEMGMAGVDADREALASDLKPVVRRVHEQPLEEISIGETLEALLKVGGQHKLRNPGETLLLTRGFLITEALIKSLDPTVNFVTLFENEIPRIAASRFTGQRLVERGKQFAHDLEQLFAAALRYGSDGAELLKEQFNATLLAKAAADFGLVRYVAFLAECV